MNLSNSYEIFLRKLPPFLGIFLLRTLNWSFQGILFAGRGERIFKISFDLLFLGIFSLISMNFYPPKISLLIGFTVSHSLNWLLLTNMWSPRIKKLNFDLNCSLIPAFIGDLKNTLRKQDYIYGAAIFGSASTGKYHDGSDIDIKLFRKKGFINYLKSYIFLSYLRTYGNIRRMPLDIYVVDDICEYSLKLNEVPIILFDSTKSIENYYLSQTAAAHPAASCGAYEAPPHKYV